MLLENEMVTMKWSNTNKNWFEEKGYTFTCYGDEFQVYSKDLMRSSLTQISAVCDICGEIETTSYFNYMNQMEKNGEYKCKACRYKMMSKNSRKRNSKDAFVKIRAACEQKGYILVSKEKDYPGALGSVEYWCPKHGTKRSVITTLLNGGGCIECGYERSGEYNKFTIEQVREVVESVNGNKWLNPEEYVNSTTNNMKIACGLCGKHPFTTSFQMYKRGFVVKCKSCAKAESIGEKNVRLYLEKYNIKYTPQKRYPDCKDKKTLPFDFYLPDYNMIIEFDGEGHFFEIYGKKSFEGTQRRDKIKNKYCEDNNILLLRIPYWQRFNEENIINWFFEQHNINIGKRYDLVSQETMRDN